MTDADCMNYYEQLSGKHVAVEWANPFNKEKIFILQGMTLLDNGQWRIKLQQEELIAWINPDEIRSIKPC